MCRWLLAATLMVLLLSVPAALRASPGAVITAGRTAPGMGSTRGNIIATVHRATRQTSHITAHMDIRSPIRAWLPWAIAVVVGLGVGMVGGIEAVVLWKQVGDVQAQLFGARGRIQQLEGQVNQFRKREAEARRIDTTPKKQEWLLSNEIGNAKPPKGYEKGYLRTLWNRSYTPRKGKNHDVAYIEWRASGRMRKSQGEELAEVLWVATVINASSTDGYNMTINLEFLDAKGFRLAQDQGKGYLFPRQQGEVLPHTTRLRGAIWLPASMAGEISEVDGSWRASVGP